MLGYQLFRDDGCGYGGCKMLQLLYTYSYQDIFIKVQYLLHSLKYYVMLYRQLQFTIDKIEFKTRNFEGYFQLFQQNELTACLFYQNQKVLAKPILYMGLFILVQFIKMK
ncbi:Hypothetical_protein [Hexamita inflata]|uniref:Hypothetical_protein n=1 Tax=Hexamita inflata TaxID=28002 RepID=A0AA86QU37_9EUKA|nr:Hypothetical protein HINF_LOCUS53721 [Hexamita inflata]